MESKLLIMPSLIILNLLATSAHASFVNNDFSLELVTENSVVTAGDVINFDLVLTNRSSYDAVFGTNISLLSAGVGNLTINGISCYSSVSMYCENPQFSPFWSYFSSGNTLSAGDSLQFHFYSVTTSIDTPDNTILNFYQGRMFFNNIPDIVPMSYDFSVYSNELNLTIMSSAVSEVPLPPSIWLLGTTLLGFMSLYSKNKRII